MSFDSSASAEQPCSQDSASTQERRAYCLALVDEETGQPRRAATELEAEAVARALAGEAALPCVRVLSESMSDSDSGTPRSAPPVGQLAKHGGPCTHCGATASPQWRRGPPTKPVLCNACGTRFRRTNQLCPLLATAAAALRGSPLLPRKRCSNNRARGEQEHAAKEPRLVSAQ